MSGQDNWSRPDEQLIALMGRPGDMPSPGNNRWGNALLLRGGQSYTFAQVGLDAAGASDFPSPMAIALAFSADGLNYSPAIPPIAGLGTITVQIIKSVDVKQKAPMVQTYTLGVGDTLPICTFLARGVTVIISNDGESAPAVWVNCTVAPTQTVDCTSIANPVDGGYSTATSTRLAAVAATIYTQPAQPTRAQFYIQNRSTADLFVSFGATVDTTPGSELATFVLPGGQSASHENSSYQGILTMQFAANDAGGYALLTTGPN